MKKKNDTVHSSAEQLETMRRRGESRTDWAKVDAMTEADLEASIAADPDDVHEAGLEPGCPGPAAPKGAHQHPHRCRRAGLV